LYLGDFADNSVIHIPFTSHDLTGAPVAPSSAFEAADIVIYKGNSATQKTSANGLTMTSPFDSLTGMHMLTIDTSVDTGDSGFWVTGADYTVVLSPDETVDGIEVRAVLARFSIENRTANRGPTKTIYVNHTGNDATSGASLESAIAAGGDPIYINSGTFALTNKVGSSVVINGLPSSTILGADGTGIFDDVAGARNFVLRGGPNVLTNDEDSCAFILRNAASTLDLDVGIVTVDSPSDSPVYVTAGKARVRAKELTSTGYDALILDGGDLFVEADLLRAGDNAVETATSTVGNLNVVAKTIIGQQVVDNSATLLFAGASNAYVKADRIQTGNGCRSIWQHTLSPASVVVDCPDIDGHITASTLHLINAKVDTRTRAVPTLTLTGDRVVLENATLVMKASELYAITASAARKLTIIGSLTIVDETGADRSNAIHSNVTLVRTLASAANLATLAGYVDTEVAAIKAKTDNLPADPADASDIAASFSSIASTLSSITSSLATLAGYVDTEVAAIKTVTDQLVATQAESSGVPAANASPLEKLNRIYSAIRNGVDVVKDSPTAGRKVFKNSSGVAQWEKDLSDDGTTYTETAATTP
jgi:hypothetical protein